MGVEIERKFLVDSDKVKKILDIGQGTTLCQSYLSTDTDRTVRVRSVQRKESSYGKAVAKGFITIKGRTRKITRTEYEYEIPIKDAIHMINNMCVGSIIIKHRFNIFHMSKCWEVDFFFGENYGLVVAEVELSYEHEEVVKPDWVLEEVSDQGKYFNSRLAKNPYKNWRNSSA